QSMEQILPRVSSISSSSFLKNCDKSTVAVPPILMEMQDKRPVSPVPPYGGGLFLIYPPANCTKKRVVFYLVRERETVCLAAKLQDGLFFDSGLVVLLQQGAADAPHRDITVKHRLHIAAGFRFGAAVAPQG